MANVRIKDITTTASAPNDDDYLAIDGATSGTRKISIPSVMSEIDAKIGDLNDLESEDKSSIVNAINWVYENGGGGFTKYTITNTLTNVTTSNGATSIIEGREYNAVLTPVQDATMQSVSVHMGGTDITSTAYNSQTGAVHIASVTGDIIIMATAVIVTHTITNRLSNITTSNEATSIVDGRPYTATLTLAESATFESCTITMGGVDITATAWDATNMTISISSVTGNLVITALAKIVEVVEVTWSTYGAQTRYGTQLIDATTKDAHAYVTFDSTSQYIAEGTSVTDVGFRIMAALYADAEKETLVGYWYNNTIHNSYTTASTESLPFETDWVCPKGYYVEIVMLKASATIFTSNSNFSQYNRENTVITLVAEDEPVEEISNAEATDNDLLRMFSLNAVSLTTETTADPTSYEGVLEEAKNAWMTEYGGSIDKIPLIIHADQHSTMTPTNSKSMWETIDNMVSWYDISGVINLGDTTNSYENFDNPVLGDTSLEQYLEATKNVPFSKRIEIFGNHDCMKIIDSALTYIPQAPNYLNPYFKNVMAKRTSNNGGWFVTYDDYFNVKYVVYSEYDYTVSPKYAVSTKQYDFLIEELSKNDGYDVILLGHMDAEIYRESTGVLAKARSEKTAGTFTDRLGVSHAYDFTACENDLLVNLHGHNHNDDYNYKNTVLSQGFKNYYDSTRPIYFVIVDRANMQLKAWKVTNTPEYTTYTRPFRSA